MKRTARNLLLRLGDRSLTVAAVLIARLRRGASPETVEASLRACPRHERVLLVAAALAGLFVVALLAAQFGLFGLAALMAGVILLVG